LTVDRVTRSAEGSQGPADRAAAPGQASGQGQASASASGQASGQVSAQASGQAAAQRVAVLATLGPLRPDALEAIRAGRGREFQRLELMGDSVLEVVIHAHALLAGPGCPSCHGRADRFTTDAHLSALAREIQLGAWLDRQPAAHRLGDLVEACVGAVWVSRRWVGVVEFVARALHPLPPEEQRTLLHGGGRLHPDCPARGREIAGAAILEAAASTGAYLRHPEGDEGDLSRIKARMLGREHVLSRCRESKWVRRTLRRRHFVRDDVERALAEDLLAHGLASAITIAWPLVT
jgi:dsRNA-specific ribonuclease